VDDARLRVCLERTIELEGASLRVRDWPGLRGPLVHMPDPLDPKGTIVEAVAAAFAPAYRVLSLAPRTGTPYQVAAADLLGLLDQFGFLHPMLIAEGMASAAALLVGAWHPGRIAKLVLVEPTYEPPASDRVEARALRDCPPDWPRLRAAVDCAVHTLRWNASAVERLGEFLNG
jgi:pimeloyl-ACP methyl ester carboxylesterase